VVDDEPDVGEVLGDVLASAGHTAVVVGSGAEAIERFQAERFDVVFTDLAMPGLTGWEVARRIKGLAPGVPVFLVTGFGVEVSAEEMNAKGVDAVLPKPLRIQDTLAVLAQLKENRA
jgi:CheY-like chemotaxis protein